MTRASTRSRWASLMCTAGSAGRPTSGAGRRGAAGGGGGSANGSAGRGGGVGAPRGRLARRALSSASSDSQYSRYPGGSCARPHRLASLSALGRWSVGHAVQGGASTDHAVDGDLRARSVHGVDGAVMARLLRQRIQRVRAVLERLGRAGLLVISMPKPVSVRGGQTLEKTLEKAQAQALEMALERARNGPWGPSCRE